MFPDDELVAFTALHRRRDVAAAFDAAGVDTDARMLPIPRPLLYEAWRSLGAPGIPRAWKADLVHAPSLAVPPRSNVPLIVTVHDAAAELYPEAFPPRGRRFHRGGMAAAARRADIILTVSEAAASEIAENSTITSDRIRVVHNGVSPKVLNPSRRDELLARFGLLGETYVFWVGSLEPRKGVDTLVAAAARLRRREGAPRFRLVLAGYEGWLRPELGSEGLVQLGRVSEEQLWALYAGASLFAFPSVHEGFGLPVVEAMSQGVPVIASDIPALREVAGGAAVLVTPGNAERWAQALADLMESGQERERLATAGRLRSAQLSEEAMVRGIRSVYREVTGR